MGNISKAVIETTEAQPEREQGPEHARAPAAARPGVAPIVERDSRRREPILDMPPQAVWYGPIWLYRGADYPKFF